MFLTAANASSRVCRSELYRVKYILYRSLLQFTAQLKAGPPSQYIDQATSADSSSTETAFGPREYVKTTAHRLHTLIAVFDFVLLGEYHSKHADLPTILSDRTGLPRSNHDNPRDHSSRRQPRLSAKARDIQTDISRWQPSACNLSCDFCGADIFQSFFECQYLCASRYDHHDGNEGDRITFSGDPFLGNGVLLCPTCYVEGRTCTCGKMKAVQCRPFDTLVLARNEAVEVVNATLNLLADSTLDLYDVINEQ